MQPVDAEQLRVYVDESSHYEGQPVYEALVAAARDEGLQGATVYRGVTSYGRDKSVRTAKIFRLSERLPLIVEFIDSAEKISAFLATVRTIVPQGLVTIQQVRVLRIGDHD